MQRQVDGTLELDLILIQFESSYWRMEKLVLVVVHLFEQLSIIVHEHARFLSSSQQLS